MTLTASKHGASGEPLVTKDSTWTWTGGSLVEKTWTIPLANTAQRGRETIEYDDEGRPVRRVQYSWSGDVPDDRPGMETRYEHRCDGNYIEDPIWP